MNGTARLLLLAAMPLMVLRGTVVGPDGHPIEKARVCYFVANVELICVATNEKGDFELFDSEASRLRITAPDYQSKIISTSAPLTPVVMEPAATLRVRLVDASTHEPIDKGEVSVIYLSGRRKGPFPVNKSGVRIERVLHPGEVRLVAEAEGYEPSEPRPATLKAREETVVEIALTPSTPKR